MIKQNSESYKNFYKAEAYNKTCFKTFNPLMPGGNKKVTYT